MKEQALCIKLVPSGFVDSWILAGVGFPAAALTRVDDDYSEIEWGNWALENLAEIQGIFPGLTILRHLAYEQVSFF